MPSLYVKDFSCIDEAFLNLAPVNVIIGPQGSGKSVTTKLLYFFVDVLSNFTQFAERGDSIDGFKKSLSKQFSTWFPPSAWGGGRFNISYSAGPFDMRVLRRRSGGVPSDEVSIKFSEWFTEFYAETRAGFAAQLRQMDEDIDAESLSTVPYERSLRARELAVNKLGAALKGDFVSQQTFIPAGRAFFTTIGRLVAGFEQAGSLDPVTVKFARLFANLKDRNSRFLHQRISRLGPEYLSKRDNFMTQLFGGELRFEGDVEFVQTPDGRKIPFSSLSSGQQELLPMWSLIDYFNERDAMRLVGGGAATRRWRRELLYIEEPEAHLFPSAQSLLMEFLIGSLTPARGTARQRSLILTTHSPYIMGKLNVFLKAGQLARRKKRNQDINDIVPRECWLNETQLAAYAIQDGRLTDLLDEEGFIDGTYLDGISEEIAHQFSRLLEIETEISAL